MSFKPRLGCWDYRVFFLLLFLTGRKRRSRERRLLIRGGEQQWGGVWGMLPPTMKTCFRRRQTFSWTFIHVFWKMFSRPVQEEEWSGGSDRNWESEPCFSEEQKSDRSRRERSQRAVPQREVGLTLGHFSAAFTLLCRRRAIPLRDSRGCRHFLLGLPVTAVKS